MIKLELLKSLMDMDEKEFKKLDEEQLRLMLGVFRYSVRAVERELNERGLKDGNIVTKSVDSSQ